jgi:acyl dehydratase
MAETLPGAARYYEDIVVGERTKTGSFTFTLDSIVAFASQYDPQPMHLSEAGGKASFFKAQIASGWQTVGITMRLMVEAHPFGTTPLIGLQIDEIKFPRPVFPGDSVSAEMEIVEKRVSKTRPDTGLLKGRTITTNQKGQDVLSQIWTILMPVRGS